MRIGAPAGVAFGSFELAATGSVPGAIFGGIFFGVFFGAFMALYMWRSWAKAKDLTSSDRVAVVRIVRRGEALDDPRLAPAVLDYVAVVQEQQNRDRRYSWLLWVFAAGALAYAVAATVDGSARLAALWWALVAF